MEETSQHNFPDEMLLREEHPKMPPRKSPLYSFFDEPVNISHIKYTMNFESVQNSPTSILEFMHFRYVNVVRFEKH